MVFASVAVPTLAVAPQPDITIRAEDNYVVQQYVLPVPTISKGVPYDECSCVSYAKYKRPDQVQPWVAPRYVEAYEIEPFVGALVITTEGPYGHVAVVTSVSLETLTVSEANYVPCSVTTRIIPRSAPSIRGYR